MEQLGRGVTKARRSFCLSEHAFSSHIINEFTFPITPWCMDIFNLPETDESTKTHKHLPSLISGLKTCSVEKP